MPRHINLRQIEAFTAVIENGTVSRAAELLNVSQPAMSKLIAHLETDTGLKLFDRVRGRLAPTEHAMRLYEEVGRIFAGVRQVENAIDAIRREEQGRLMIGIMPAMAGSFIQRVMSDFLKGHPNVYCGIHSGGSQRMLDWVITRRLDVALIDAGMDNPYVTSEPLMNQSLACILPLEHPLAAKSLIQPKDLQGCAFIGVQADTYIGRQVDAMFEAYGVQVATSLVANVAPAICEFVAAGLGVSLLPPLFVIGLEHRLAVRRFEPEIPYSFQLCRSADRRNARLVDAFTATLRETATRVSAALIAA